MLVAAVLRPEEREDRQLEVVGLALEPLDDACELTVGEAERSVKGLFGDRAQGVSVPALSDGFGPAEHSGRSARWKDV
jgi:hypothetical protein